MLKKVVVNLSGLYLRGATRMSTGSEKAVKFFEAIEKDDIDKVDEMLKGKEVTVETRNSEEQNGTALHLAAYGGNIRIVKLLVEKYNADVNAKDDWGKNPLQTAFDNYHRKVCKYLIERKSENAEYAEGILNPQEVDDIFEAAEANDIAKVTELIETKGVDVDSQDRGGYRATILHVAARKGYEELARLLVDKYKANINHEDEIGDRTIHIAAQCGHVNIVKLLAERNSKDSDEMLKFVVSNKDAPVMLD